MAMPFVAPNLASLDEALVASKANVKFSTLLEIKAEIDSAGLARPTPMRSDGRPPAVSVPMRGADGRPVDAALFGDCIVVLLVGLAEPWNQVVAQFVHRVVSYFERHPKVHVPTTAGSPRSTPTPLDEAGSGARSRASSGGEASDDGAAGGSGGGGGGGGGGFRTYAVKVMVLDADTNTSFCALNEIVAGQCALLAWRRGQQILFKRDGWKDAVRLVDRLASDKDIQRLAMALGQSCLRTESKLAAASSLAGGAEPEARPKTRYVVEVPF